MHGPVRVNTSAGTGDATVTILFDAWSEGQVAPSVHTLRVIKPRTTIKLQPVAPELKKTLVHPDRKASVGQIQFSPDGTRLFASGYPSGVVQVFDIATGKELRRIAGPRGGRSSAAYAVPSADWKTVYVAVETRKAERVVKDGKSLTVPKYTGEIRVFDLATGDEKPALAREGNGAVATVTLSPDGKTLIARETTAGVNEKGERTNTSHVVEWDPAARTHKVVGEGYRDDRRSKDGRWKAASFVDYEKLTTSLKLTDTKNGKETDLIVADKKAVGWVIFSRTAAFWPRPSTGLAATRSAAPCLGSGDIERGQGAGTGGRSPRPVLFTGWLVPGRLGPRLRHATHRHKDLEGATASGPRRQGTIRPIRLLAGRSTLRGDERGEFR